VGFPLLVTRIEEPRGSSPGSVKGDLGVSQVESLLRRVVDCNRLTSVADAFWRSEEGKEKEGI